MAERLGVSAHAVVVFIFAADLVGGVQKYTSYDGRATRRVCRFLHQDEFIADTQIE
jgi:hypothetical protein